MEKTESYYDEEDAGAEQEEEESEYDDEDDQHLGNQKKIEDDLIIRSVSISKIKAHKRPKKQGAEDEDEGNSFTSKDQASKLSKRSKGKKEKSIEIEFADNKKIGDTFRSGLTSEKNFGFNNRLGKPQQDHENLEMPASQKGKNPDPRELEDSVPKVKKTTGNLPHVQPQKQPVISDNRKDPPAQERSGMKSGKSKKSKKSTAKKEEESYYDEEEEGEEDAEEEEYESEYESEVQKSKTKSMIQKGKKGGGAGSKQKQGGWVNNQDQNEANGQQLLKKKSTPKNQQQLTENILGELYQETDFLEKSIENFAGNYDKYKKSGKHSNSFNSFELDGQQSARAFGQIAARGNLGGGDESLDDLKIFEKISEKSSGRLKKKQTKTSNYENLPNEKVQEEENEEDDDSAQNSFNTKSHGTKRSEAFNPLAQYKKVKKRSNHDQEQEEQFQRKQDSFQDKRDDSMRKSQKSNKSINKSSGKIRKSQNNAEEIIRIDQQEKRDTKQSMDKMIQEIKRAQNEESFIQKQKRDFVEYELDQYGNKVIMSKNRPQLDDSNHKRKKLQDKDKSFQKQQQQQQQLQLPTQQVKLSDENGYPTQGFGSYMLINQLNNLAAQTKIDHPLNKEQQNQKIKIANAAEMEGANMHILDKQPFTDDEIKEAFFTFDMNGNGYIGVAEIKFVLDALGEEVTDEEIDEMVRMLDIDGDGQVNFKEFYKMASGQSLAPIGVALPPPRDMQIGKRLNQSSSSQSSMKKNKDGKKGKVSFEKASKGKKGKEEEEEYDDELEEEDSDNQKGGKKGFKKITQKGKEDEESSEFESDDEEEQNDGALNNLVGIKNQPKKAVVQKDLTKSRGEQQNRKGVMKDIATKYGYDSKAIKKMHEVYIEQEMSQKLTYQKFIKFLKVDETPMLRNAFELLAGSINDTVDARILMLLLMNVSPLSKEEKLKFAFNLFDEEDSRMITYGELLKILQANYFASSTEEVEQKAKLILDETSAKNNEDPISYEDFMALAKKYSALFFPTNL